MLECHLTPEQLAKTLCYVVATDSFLSGWGKCPGTSYYVVACPTREIAEDVERRMRMRSDFKRVRVNHKPPRPRNAQRDHVSIVWYDEFTYGR